MPRTVSDNRSEKCLDVSRKGRGGEKVKMFWHSRDGASAAVFRHWKEEMSRNSRWVELLAFLGRCREN